MIKKILLLATLQIIFMGEGKADFSLYEDRKQKFSIQYPSHWEYQDHPQTEFIFIRPIEEHDQIFRENINLIINSDEGLSLEEYTVLSKLQLRNKLTRYQHISTDYVTVNGIETARITYTHSMNDLNLKVLYYIILYNDKAYNFTASSTIDNFEEFFPLFEKIINTFKM